MLAAIYCLLFVPLPPGYPFWSSTEKKMKRVPSNGAVSLPQDIDESSLRYCRGTCIGWHNYNNLRDHYWLWRRGKWDRKDRVFFQFDGDVLSNIVFPAEKGFQSLLVRTRQQRACGFVCIGEEPRFSGPMCHSRRACRLQTAIRRSPTFKKPPGKRNETLCYRTKAARKQQVITAQRW
jgi:hypothetical protein